MTVVSFPSRTPAPPNLELLSYVFAAMSHLGEPASAEEMAAVIAECLDAERHDEILGEVSAILEYYCRTPLSAPIEGRVFRRIGGRFAYTVEFRALLAQQGFRMTLRRPPDATPADEAGEARTGAG